VRTVEDILDNYTLVKTAAPKWVKQQRAGQLSPENLARTVHSTGQIRQLSKGHERGAEGFVHKVTHPAAATGVAARKTYDPEGPLFSRQLFREKNKMYKAMQNQPWGIKFYGADKGGKPISYHEWVDIDPGFKAIADPKFSPKIAVLPGQGRTSLYDRAVKQRVRHDNLAQRAARAGSAGKLQWGDKINEFLKSRNLMPISDLHAGNLVKQKGTGQYKLLDFFLENPTVSKTPLARQFKQEMRSMEGLPLPKNPIRERYIDEYDRMMMRGQLPGYNQVAAKVHGGQPLIPRKEQFTDLDPRFKHLNPRMQTENPALNIDAQFQKIFGTGF
jgi:hypothetical protein